MPRPNPLRSISSERTLARRIAYERERRSMSYDGLASRMTQAGCPIQASGLYKVEKSGRRITVDELVALARVWDLSVEELLQPVEMILNEDIRRVEEGEQDAWRRLFQAAYDVVERRDERAELYRRATEGSDEELAGAVSAFWAEREAQAQEVRPGAIEQIAKDLAAGDAGMTDDERAAHERKIAIEVALNPLIDAIYANTDDILGDS